MTTPTTEPANNLTDKILHSLTPEGVSYLSACAEKAWLFHDRCRDNLNTSSDRLVAVLLLISSGLGAFSGAGFGKASVIPYAIALIMLFGSLARLLFSTRNARETPAFHHSPAEAVYGFEPSDLPLLQVSQLRDQENAVAEYRRQNAQIGAAYNDALTICILAIPFVAMAFILKTLGV